MLKNIKSFFVIKKLFSYISDKYKLDLIKYNKIFQKKFSLNILDYRYHSGKYINYVSDSIIEEYNSYNDELIFIGGKLNGKRNIFGVEYYHDIVIFKGEYLNGKKHGKGMEYNYDGILKFEGDYLYGKKWNGKVYDIHDGTVYKILNGKGFIKEYDNFGNLIFEGI